LLTKASGHNRSNLQYHPEPPLPYFGEIRADNRGFCSGLLVRVPRYDTFAACYPVLMNSANMGPRANMTAYISRPSPQMAAIFSCDKCPEAYASPADLDHHRQIHDFTYDASRFASPVNGSRSRSMTVGQARVEQVVATPVISTPVVATRCFFFCSTCNTRVDSPLDLTRHNEQYHQSPSIGNGYTPQPPREIPSPEPYWSPSSAFGPPPSWEQGMQVQSAPPVNYSTGPVQPPTSPQNLVVAVFDPQYVAHMPPVPASNAIQTGNVSWIDFLDPIEGREPCNQIVEYEDTNFPPSSDQFWPRPIDMNLSGHHFPSDVLDVSLESLGLLFDAGGVPRIYEAAEAQAPYLPAMNLLNQLCANYFSFWQPNQPVFHTATWSFIDYPMVLVSAMACVGSTFTQESEVLRQANYINERCITELNRLTQGAAQHQDIEYIAALCIHQTYLIGSGHDQIHEHADRVRSYMIEGLQAQNLLGPDLFDASYMMPPSLTADAVYIEWCAWVSHEQRVRVAWMVFEYDCSLSLLTGRPCAIALGHLPKAFPCEDALYNAPNAYAWAELVANNASLEGPEVSGIITLTLNRLNLPQTASSWTKRLCAHVFERLLRGLLDPDQQNSTIASAREINLHLTSSLSSIQMKLLWSISYLSKSASIYNQSPTLQSTRDIDDYEMVSTFKLNYHSNHFGLCTRIMYAIRFITLAAISPPSDSQHAELPVMQQRLIQELASVPQHARLYVYNAGQMFRTARESPLVTPVDYLRIFTAYLAILAFVKYGPSSRYDVPGVDPFHADVFPFFPTRSDRWLEHGGPATVGDCGVFYPGCSTELIMRDAYRELCGPGGWKLKKRFYCVLARFDALEVQRS
ncbi:hypothetical protein MKX08_003771, partial [Trichoderma sp. CBMAI-0020]